MQKRRRLPTGGGHYFFALFSAGARVSLVFRASASFSQNPKGIVVNDRLSFHTAQVFSREIFALLGVNYIRKGETGQFLCGIAGHRNGAGIGEFNHAVLDHKKLLVRAGSQITMNDDIVVVARLE